MKYKFIIVKDINVANQLKKQGYSLLFDNGNEYFFENKDDTSSAFFNSVDSTLYTYTNKMFF